MTAAGMQVHAMPLTVQGTLLDRVGLQFQDQVVVRAFSDSMMIFLTFGTEPR